MTVLCVETRDAVLRESLIRKMQAAGVDSTPHRVQLLDEDIGTDVAIKNKRRRTSNTEETSMCRMLCLSIGLLFLSTAGAADFNCGGRITRVMADHPGCGGNIAFKTDGSGGVWMCTKSKEGSSLVLAVALFEKPVLVYIEATDVGGACASLPQYRDVSYVIVDP